MHFAWVLSLGAIVASGSDSIDHSLDQQLGQYRRLFYYQPISIGPMMEADYSIFLVASKYDQVLQFFHSAAKNNIEWFKINLKTIPACFQLALAFKYPRLTPHVDLPIEMPPVDRLLNVREEFSFEKARYIEQLYATYGPEKVLLCFKFYAGSSKAYRVMLAMADPTIEIEKDLLEIPGNLIVEEKEDWQAFFSQRSLKKLRQYSIAINLGQEACLNWPPLPLAVSGE